MTIIRNILFISIASLALFYWVGKLKIAADTLPVDRYSKDKLEGVRLAKYQDLRGIRGSLNMQHEFATYVEKATSYIAEYGGERFFNADYDTPKWMELYPNVAEFHVLPITNNNYFLGFNRVTKFKVEASKDNIKVLDKLVGTEVVLTNEKGLEYEGVISAVNDDVLSVEGYFPFTFFPDELKVLNSGTPRNFKLMLESNILGWVRGGVFQYDNLGRTMLLIPMPGQNVEDVQIRVGDKITLADGKEMEVGAYFRLGHYTIVTINESNFEPYYDSRRNVVEVKREKTIPKRQIVFDIKKTTNENFLFGKDRYFRFHVEQGEYSMSPRSLTSFESGTFPYFISNVQDGLITIDLLRSLAFSTCKSILSDSCINMVDSIGESLHDTENYRNLINFFNVGADSKTLINNNHPKFDMMEMWNRGGQVRIFGNTDDASKQVQVSESKLDLYKMGEGVWEIYPGSLLNIYYSTYNPAPTEMLIHVLGKEARSEYYSSFIEQKPTFLSYAKPERFSPWLVNWHWPFFKNIARYYTLSVDTNEFSLFHKNTNDWEVKEEFKILEQANPIKLPDSLIAPTQKCELALYTVKVNYKIDNPIQSLPLLGKTPRYFIDVGNTGFASSIPVSVPWSENEFQFPVIFRKGFEPTLDVRETSSILGGKGMSISRISYFEENISQEKLLAFKFDYPGVSKSFNHSCFD